VSSTAFNRPEPWETERNGEIALNPAEVAAFGGIVEEVIASRREAFARGFIAESPEKLRRLPDYFAALNSDGPFPAVRCNAPWVSAVVEADGTVRPCFFHPPLGNLHTQPLVDIVNGEQAIAFRRQLDVASNQVCRRCVCILYLGRRAAV
jgi:Fe-coproporphyrin III synthase